MHGASPAQNILMKGVWALILVAAALTLYVRIEKDEPIVQPVHHFHHGSDDASPRPSPPVVVAPFQGGSVGSRLKDATPKRP
jgi:hypothetical protein